MVIVTGANGFIGSALVWELNQKGCTDILCVDTVPLKERSLLLAKSKFSDFLTEKALLSWLQNAENCIKIQCVFHLGACSSTSEMDVEYLRENNTNYTKKLFEACSKSRIPFIYASSGAVYGNGQYGFDDLANSEQFTPLNPYGWSKLNFDTWAVKQDRTPPLWYGLRFFNVYGPNEYHKSEMCSVVFKAYNQIKSSGKLKLFKSHNIDYADGYQMRDFIYIKDITRWMVELYENAQLKSGIYNMGYGKAHPWMDLAKAVFTNMNTALNIDWIDIPIHLKDQYQYFTEAKMNHWDKQKGSSPQWSLEDAIGDYLQNYLLKDDPFL